MESYESILKRMEENFKNITGHDADKSADIGIKMRLLASELYSCYGYLNWLKNEMFIQTANGNSLDNHAILRGLERKKGTYATGKIEFSVTVASLQNIVIPIGTICSTSGVSPLFFEVTEETILPAGHTAVLVNAKAQEVGVKYNVLSSTINTCVTVLVGIEKINNVGGFSGGTDSEDDNSFRQRIIENIKSIPLATNSKFYEEEAKTIDGVYYANVLPQARGIGTINVYVYGKNSACSYAQVQEVSTYLNSIREINCDISVYNATLFNIDVSISVKAKAGYSQTEVEANCYKNISNYINSINIGSTLILSELNQVVYNCEGVEYFNVISPTSNVSVSSSLKPYIGTVDVEFRNY